MADVERANEVSFCSFQGIFFYTVNYNILKTQREVLNKPALPLVEEKNLNLCIY